MVLNLTHSKNTPKNGLVDRIQIHRYPHNSGEIEPHQHNPKNIRNNIKYIYE